MATTKAIHELKNELSSVLAQVAATGEEVQITKHGRVIARLVAPEPTGVVFGAGADVEVIVPDLDDLHWTLEELAEMSGGAVWPE